jgi:hypothetical protein
LKLRYEPQSNVSSNLLSRIAQLSPGTTPEQYALAVAEQALMAVDQMASKHAKRNSRSVSCLHRSRTYSLLLQLLLLMLLLLMHILQAPCLLQWPWIQTWQRPSLKQLQFHSAAILQPWLHLRSQATQHL